MKIKRDILEKIVYEEFIRFLGEQKLNEAPLTTPEEEEELPPDPENAPEEPTGMPELGSENEEDPQTIPDEEPEEVAKTPDEEGSVAQELEGKTIASISMDEDSKVMPGATEVVLTFNETQDALRILITNTGRVKFFFRGLHNSLETGANPEEGEEGEYTLAPDDVDDVPDGSSIASVDTPVGTRDDEEEDEEEIEI